MSEFKAQELILPASYLIDLSAAMNLEERFAGRSDRSALRLQVQGDKWLMKKRKKHVILIIVCIIIIFFPKQKLKQNNSYLGNQD